MRGIKYELLFLLPSGTLHRETGLSCNQLRERLTELFQLYYDYQYTPNTDSIYNLNRRPDNVSRFVSQHVSISRAGFIAA